MATSVSVELRLSENVGFERCFECHPPWKDYRHSHEELFTRAGKYAAGVIEGLELHRALIHMEIVLSNPPRLPTQFRKQKNGRAARVR